MNIDEGGTLIVTDCGEGGKISKDGQVIAVDQDSTLILNGGQIENTSGGMEMCIRDRFITVACGAISGFHATQSPLMARCLQREKDGRKVFYGALISEGIIALVWAAAGVAFYGATGGLQQALNNLGASGVVYDISVSLLGIVGGAIAIVGVVVCPISSGDTAFRSARLTLADWFKIDQSKIAKRLAITLPLLAVGALLTQVNFDIIWRRCV